MVHYSLQFTQTSHSVSEWLHGISPTSPVMTKFPTVSEAVIDPAEFQGNASNARSRLHSLAHTEARSIPAAPSSL